LATLVLAGCSANFHSIYRTTAADENKIITTDAKQAQTIVQMGKDGVMRACAAKSPDVFQALSTAFSGNLSVEEASQIAAKIAGAGSTAESSASYRLHTQLTDTQNELLYQLCVNALNGTISKDQLATELHRYQNTMVTMLAIEQLTGYAKPTIVGLGAGSASTGSADSIAKLQASIDALRANEQKINGLLQTANKTAEAKKTAYDTQKKKYDDEKDETKKAALEPALKEAENQLKTAQGDVATYTAGLGEATKARQGAEAARDKALADATTNANGATVKVDAPTATGLNDQTAAKVADAVVALQKNHLTQRFTSDECLAFLFRGGSNNGGKTEGPPNGQQQVDGLKQQMVDFCFAQLQAISDYAFQSLYLNNNCTIDGKNCSPPTKTIVVVTGGEPPATSSEATTANPVEPGNLPGLGDVIYDQKNAPAELPSM
jgi:hypothetical protein